MKWIGTVLVLFSALTADAADPHAGSPAVAGSAGAITDGVEFIDRELEAAWKKLGKKPSRPATDEEFLRRASLDILGRIPTLEEMQQFEKAPAAERRAKLCDRLVENSEFAKHTANRWSYLLLDLTPPLAGFNYEQQSLEAWMSGQLKKNVPWDRLASQLLTANVDEYRGVGSFLSNGRGERRTNPRFGTHTFEPATNLSMKLFMGAHVECAQCHNNFFDNRLSQQRYWELNAFFRQTDLLSGGPKEDKSLNAQGFIYYQDTSGETYSAYPRFLDGQTPDPKKHPSRRHALAHFIVNSAEFPKVILNRYWEQMFGQGLNGPDAVDNLSDEHPVIFPELMDGLAAKFRQAGLQPKELVRWMCKSKAYGLSSTRAGNIPDEQTSFEFMPVKRMTPYQFSRSLPLALHADPGRFTPKILTDAIVTDSDENGVTTVRGSHLQKLALLNSPTILDAVRSFAQKSFGENEADLIDTYYRSLLGRPALEIEKTEYRSAVKTQTGREDLIWSLMNSSQFILSK